MFKFLNNQEIRFNSFKFDDQACINKDLSAYSVLKQPGDPLHWQAKLGCCDDNEACDPETLGAELVTNGAFAADSDWTKGTGWSIGSGVATFTANGGTESLNQGIAVTVGMPYQIFVTVTANSTGFDIYVFLGARRIGIIPANTTGTFPFYGPAGITGGGISFTTGFDYGIADSGSFSIDNVSVKAIATCYTFGTSTRQYVVNGAFTSTSSPWFLSTGWTWNAGNFIRHTTPAALGDLDQLLTGIKHRHNIEFSVAVSNRTTGSVLYEYGGVNMQTISANGTTTFNYSANGIGNNFIQFFPTGNFDGDIDTVSANETASGWTFDPESGFCHETGWVNPFYAGNTLAIGRYYKLTVEIICNNGSVLVEAGGQTLGTVTKTDIYDFYFTATATNGEKFTPSSDFDGCISPNIYICPLFRDGVNGLQARLVYADGTGATDWHTTASASNPLILDGDFLTWRINSLSSILSGGVPVSLPYSCYYVQVKKVCDLLDPPSVTTKTSDTIINYKESHPCSKLFMSYCDGDALNFRFGDDGNNFRIYSRLRTLYMNPGYPIKSPEDYEFSSGLTQRIYASLGKRYEILFDYADEYAHDCIAAMIVCDFMYIDNQRFLAEGKDYEPNWPERGKRNLAQSTLNILLSEEGLFNRNCS